MTEYFETGIKKDRALLGLSITLPEQCPACHGHDAVIGASHGPYKISIMCACGRHLGWLSVESFNFLTEIVRCFGRPTEPICVRRKAAKDDADVSSSTTKA
jgi:hypothetical protein